MTKYLQYDLRQINLMRSLILDYNSGSKSLIYLLNDLKSLFNCLKSKKNKWRESFLKEWNEIEIIYAFAVSNEEKLLSDNDMKIIDQSLKNILELLDKY